MGNYTAAIQDYTAAILVDPDNSYAFYNRGITRDRVADLAGAIADFTDAAQLNPNNADFFHNRGFSLRKLVRPCLPRRSRAQDCVVRQQQRVPQPRMRRYAKSKGCVCWQMCGLRGAHSTFSTVP